MTSEDINSGLLGIIFLFIGVVGYFVMLYLNQLRAESLMYARSINNIRKYMYTKYYNKDNDLEQINQYSVLLTQDKKPKYFDVSQFIFVVVVLGLFNSFYLGVSIYTLIPLPGIYCQWALDNTNFVAILLAAIWFAFHIVSFKLMSIYNENGSAYFKRIIGVDIDGVLNKHEEQFVDIYNKLFSGSSGSKLDVSDITTLPVSNSGVIKRDDEHQVFKMCEYWDTMPKNDECDIYLTQEIRNHLGFKVHIFTWRDWKVNYSMSSRGISNYSMKKQTKKWLKEKGIIYNKICFEKGNIEKPVKIYNRKYRTRFYYSAKRNIKYFVEDNILNAIKLSSICKYVFLLDHLYNSGKQHELPYNVIRASSWKEILDKIKELE